MMQALNTVLVALDVDGNGTSTKPGSTNLSLNHQVFRSLQHLQLAPTTKVVIAHVISNQHQEADIMADRLQTESIEPFPHSRIEQQLQTYQKALPCQSELEIMTGDPAEEILRLANIYKADLVVIGSRGLKGMERILLGSVSSQIVTDAPCSVLVVKGL